MKRFVGLFDHHPICDNGQHIPLKMFHKLIQTLKFLFAAGAA